MKQWIQTLYEGSRRLPGRFGRKGKELWDVVAGHDRRLAPFELGLRILLAVYVFFFFLSQFITVFSIPIDKPYYTGTWDEPFSINSGINVLHKGGDPLFYNYGGTSVYPYSLVYYYYCKDKGITPTYQLMDKPFYRPAWPITRKISPVKPIFITRVVAYTLFLIGAFAFAALFVLLLLPAPFWIIPSIMGSGVFVHYATQMLPEIHIGLLAGLAAVFFARALLQEEAAGYFRNVLLCAVFASFTVGAKINSFFIVLLPLSLMWRLVKEKVPDWKQWLFLLGGLGVPYLLVNPALLFNTGKYITWLESMLKLSATKPQMWMNRTAELTGFIKNLYLFNAFPAVVLMVLFLWSCLLITRKNPPAFLGLMFFIFYSFYKIANMEHMLYVRHFSFLILPIAVFLLFPLAYLFSRSPRGVRGAAALVCLLVTLWVYPPGPIARRIGKLPRKTFTTKWKKESRDHLEAFVKKRDAVLYFYDFHGFSLPETIRHKIFPFTRQEQLPPVLKDEEYVGLILYEKAEKSRLNSEGKYNRDLEWLMQRYKPVKIFGKPGGAYDINKADPQVNPTILLMKAK